MIAEETYEGKKVGFMTKLKAYASFAKMRLSILVVVSALSGYLFMGGGNTTDLILMMVGGALLTASSNGFNQIWERDLDKLMDRTKTRPLVTGTMSVTEAWIFAIVAGISGLIMLFYINVTCGVLGLLSIFSYVLLYTPLKRVTAWSVLVGAFPGAFPPMIGAVAATGEFSQMAGILFFVQFMWQFPHFWAIAWVVHEDYQKAGFFMLPSKKGKSKGTAFQIALYTLILVPVSLIPWVLGKTGTTTLIVASIAGAVFFLLAHRLYITLDDKVAKRLMFYSFIYLPIIQFLYYFDKI